MPLIEPTPNSPCWGHPCDGCHLCKKGRCCRKDMPDYKLPHPGSWDGPIYGEIGLLREADGKVECHICGTTFRSLPIHVFRKHGVWPDEYKILFGINVGTGLVCSSTAAAFRDHCRRLRADGRMSSGGIPRTPEQLSALLRGRRNRAQGLRTIKAAASKRPYYGDKIAETKTKGAPWLLCPVCQKEFKRNHRRKKYCSPECGREGARIANRHPWYDSICQGCGVVFKWQPHPSHSQRLFCSRECSRAAFHPSEAQKKATGERTRNWYLTASSEQKAERERKRQESRQKGALRA